MLVDLCDEKVVILGRFKSFLLNDIKTFAKEGWIRKLEFDFSYKFLWVRFKLCLIDNFKKFGNRVFLS